MELQQLAQVVAQVADRFGVRMAVLFGSAVSGRLSPDSDLDVAVQLEIDEPAYHDVANLEFELQKAVPDRELDLSLLNRADPLFLHKIMESCRLLYGDEWELQRLKMYSFRRFQDHKPFLRFEREYVRQVIHRTAKRP